MRTVTIEIFEFHELTEKAQERAYRDWKKGRIPDAWDDEYRTTLEALEKELQVKVTGWNVGEDCSHFNFECRQGEGVEALQGLRAFKWLINNISFTVPRERLMGRPTYIRESKVFKEDNSLTGFGAGYVMVEVFKDLLEDRACLLHALTVETFCEWVLEKFFDEWRTDKEDQMSFSYFADGETGEFYVDGMSYND